VAAARLEADGRAERAVIAQSELVSKHRRALDESAEAEALLAGKVDRLTRAIAEA